MNKAVFLDRDGTINVDNGYVYKCEDLEFIPGAIEGLLQLQRLGYLLIILTNQSGIARGYYSEEDFWIFTKHLKNELRKKGIIIDDVLYCPHHPNAKISQYKIDCNCRKPKLGMFFKAINKWNLDVDKCIAIGDKERDLSICNISKCKGFLISKKESSCQNIMTVGFVNPFEKIIRELKKID